MGSKKILKHSIGAALTLTLLAAPSALIAGPTAFDSVAMVRVVEAAENSADRSFMVTGTIQRAR